MTTMTDNERRAERAYRALLRYAQDDYSPFREDVEAAAVDLMSDLLHMLDLQYGLEPEDAQRMAWSHFTAERES